MTKDDNRKNLWQVTGKGMPGCRQLDSDTTADLVVIGAGFTGCSTALRAAELGASVVVLEAETVGFGGSGRNVGLVNSGLWLPPEEIERKMGVVPARRLSTALANSHDLVFSLIEKHGIDCEAVRNGTLHCGYSLAEVQDLEDRAAQRNARGEAVKVLDADETARRTGSQAFLGALFDPRAGTVQPLNYCNGLANAAIRAGARIYGRSKAVRVAQEAGTWLVHTAKARVRAKALVVATNAYHSNADGIDAPQFVPMHFFQMATAPLDAATLKTILPNREGCWDNALVMSSFRLDAAGRLIIGGLGALSAVCAPANTSWAARKLAKLFPGLKGEALVERWHGRIAVTNDHIPKIQRIGENGYAVFGYSGRGIGPGTVFGQATAESIVSGDAGVLPVEPSTSHAEAATGLKQVWYEAGTALVHSVSASISPR